MGNAITVGIGEATYLELPFGIGDKEERVDNSCSKSIA